MQTIESFAYNQLNFISVEGYFDRKELVGYVALSNYDIKSYEQLDYLIGMPIRIDGVRFICRSVRAEKYPLAKGDPIILLVANTKNSISPLVVERVSLF